MLELRSFINISSINTKIWYILYDMTYFPPTLTLNVLSCNLRVPLLALVTNLVFCYCKIIPSILLLALRVALLRHWGSMFYMSAWSKDRCFSWSRRYFFLKISQIKFHPQQWVVNLFAFGALFCHITESKFLTCAITFAKYPIDFDLCLWLNFSMKYKCLVYHIW